MVPRSIDIAVPRAKLAVLVHGCFWHGCPTHGSSTRANADWWRNKIARTVARDRETSEHLSRIGWQVLTVWEHEAPTDALDVILQALRI